MRKFSKNIIKGFKTGFGRFLAIMAIVALGVGFLIGIMQSTPDMKKTMSNYYLDNKAYDVDIKGTLGITATDVEIMRRLALTEEDKAYLKEIGVIDDEISRLEEIGDIIEDVTPIISTDVIVEVNGSGNGIVGRMIGIEGLSSKENLNQLTLKAGEWPDAPDEVVALRGGNYFEDVAIGDEITLPEKIDYTNATYGDVYISKKCKVVGIVSSPDYYYRDVREVTSLGTGTVGCILYGESQDMYDLQKEGLLFQYLNDEYIMGALGIDTTLDIRYTDCYVTLKDTEEYERFTDDYKNFVLSGKTKLEELGKLCSSKFDPVLENEFVGNLIASMGLTFSDAEWMILDRASNNVSYISYDLNVEKVEDIAGVFPIFFIVVAALVALTSMTRMVEEDRMQIGTFKALGYGNARIMSKYLIYCCLATLIGCIVGILVGFGLLPSIIWQAYGTIYQLPALSLGFSLWFALAVFGVALFGTVLVTWATCRASLKEKPSALMQPKAPKAGKRIVVERIGFLWKPLKFKWKATIRNIFRYKRNMLLTIISVMGCTALILAGFGLNDSVVAASDLQYSKIIRYDCVIEHTAGDFPEEGVLRDFIGTKEQEGERYIDIYSESGRLIFGDSSESVDLYLVEDASQFRSFVSLRNREDSAIIDITRTDESAYVLREGAAGAIVVPENIALAYEVEVGDIIGYRVGTDEAKLVVYGVCENYIGSSAYMSRVSYERLFGEKEDNTLLVKSGVGREDEDSATSTLFEEKMVMSVTFVSSEMEMFEGLESTMGLVIAVLVVSAGGLAAIVLYNLTNINIEERRREIATLRVLGYRKSEVAGYIYRESAILTVVGSLFGLLLGFLLHMFIVSRVNSVTMMFGKSIAGLSYLWAFLLTIAFAIVVYAFMLIKLYRIDMAESLKSNE